MNQIAKIQAAKFSCFDHLSSEIKNEQLKAISYIERMAGVTATDISSVDLFEVFGAKTADKALLVTSKGEINKRLFELGKAPKPATLPGIEGLKSATFQPLQNIFQTAQKNRLDKLVKEHRSLLQSAEERARQEADYRVGAWRLQVEMMMIEGGSLPDLASELEKIPQSGFWAFDEIRDGAVFFKTTADIVLTNKNRKAGLDTQVNMGRYKASYSPATNKVQVHPWERNPVVQETYFHPFVGGLNGRTCFGNADDQARKLLQEFKLAEYFELLTALLSTYQADSNPYIALENFAEAVKRGGYTFIIRCRQCGGVFGSSCNCHTCPTCGPTGRRRCSSHYCGTCETYNRPNCGCYDCCNRTEDEGHADDCYTQDNDDEEAETESEETDEEIPF